MKFPSRLIFRLHALQRMFEREITEQEIREILANGEVIQMYGDDKPYPSYLVLGEFKKRYLHVVIAVNEEDQESIVITSYEPKLADWEEGFAKRRKG